jgi:hypothetical protein
MMRGDGGFAADLMTGGGGFTAEDLITDEPVRYRRSDPMMRWAIWGMAGAAALGAILAPGRPTGIWLADAVWRAAFAVVLTLAASRSRRWPTVWLAGLSCAFSGGLSLVLAVGSFGLAAANAFGSLRNRLLGAGAGALAAQALLRLPDRGFHGLATLVVIAAVVPVLYSAYDCAHRSTRKLVRRSLLVGGALVALAVAGLAVATALAFPKLDSAVDDTRAGHNALEKPNLPVAAQNFDDAAKSFGAAESALGALWAQPARLLPVLSQHRDVMYRASASGHDLTETAAEVATIAPYQELRSSAGQVDLVQVERMQEPVAESVAVLREATDVLGDVRSPWLLEPLTRKVDQFSAELDDALPEAELASEALDLSPAILGGEGPRRYLVLFTSPAETRFLGGFAGAYGILNANAGKVTFDESGNISDLNQIGDPTTRVLPEFEGRQEYEARYARFFPQRFFQNLTVSPDLPTDALVTRDLYQQSTGQAIDGVIVADPYALAGFLELTGPVEVPGVANKITADNVVDYLLIDQYVEFQGDNEARRDRLGDVADATFDALTSRDLPGPRRIGQALSPAVHEKHLMVWMFDETDQGLFDSMGAGGQFEPGSGDYFSLRTANGSANKIDSFLERSVNYDVEFDPTTGATEANATIVLENAAPLLLPDYVIGNSSGQPSGTNVMYLSFYSPLQLVAARRDGQPVTTSSHRELGTNVYSMEVMVPPGGAVTLDLELSGVLEPGDYELVASSQPLVNDDRVTLAIRSGADTYTARATGDLAGSTRAATWSGDLDRDREWRVEFVPLP